MSNPWGDQSGRDAHSAGATATQEPAGKKSGASDFDTVKTTDPYSFDTPQGMSEFRMSDFVGELVLVEPTEYIPSMMTSVSKEPTDAFRVDIIPLTGEHAEERLADMMIFQVALKSELKRTWRGTNPLLLARVVMGEAKQGKNAPYKFGPPSPDDVAMAKRWTARQSK